MSGCATKQYTAAIVPRVDVVEGPESVVITAELPGVKKDGIELSVNDGILSLIGRKTESVAEGSVRVAERRHGEFRRSFSLGRGIDATRVDAQMDNGILKITLQKSESVKPKKITIN
jgi:HSP20 family protein